MKKEKTFVLDDMIVSFYFLEEMQSIICTLDTENPQKAEMPSRLKLKEDLQEIKTQMQKSLAVALYDYLIFAMLHEATASYDNCKITYKEFMGIPSKFLSPRTICRNIDEVDDKNVLHYMEFLYSQEWEDYFGGDAWLNIVRVAKMYKKIPDYAFIDACVDLQHNTGSVFSKNWNRFVSFQSFDDFIEFKSRNFDFREFIAQVLKFEIPYEIFKIFERFYRLYYFKYMSPDILMFIRNSTLFFLEQNPDEWDNLINYEPIQYKGIYKFQDSDFVLNLNY